MPSEDATLQALLSYIRAQRGIDFSVYKPASLQRRLQKRMGALDIESYDDYLDHLQASPDEFTQFFDTICINVTQFFRDPQAWETIEEKVLPELVSRPGDSTIRVWCAGAATGQEPYTIAMLLADALGITEFQRRVKIYATDVDEGAIAIARQGTFTTRQMEPVPEDRRKRYFEESRGALSFRPDVRRSIMFGHHNLLQDAPISRLDLLICRNTLMYFNREAQNRVLARFHFALRDTGFLFLGKAELLLTRRNLFVPVHAPSRIFSKVPQLTLQDRLSVLAAAGSDNGGSEGTVEQLRDMAFDSSPMAQVVVNRDGNLVMVNESARRQFSIQVSDVGRTFTEVPLSYRPVELRSLIERMYEARTAIAVTGVEMRDDAKTLRYLDINVAPVSDNGGAILGASITFADATSTHELHIALEQSRTELETAYEELQSTNEELETTNEELQSTIEELETTNEEMQSTNEELETMNEELQSTNEEIRTVNDELREQTDAVTRLNSYMGSILNSLQSGVVVLDEGLNIRMWNDKATDLWGVRHEEVEGRSFLDLDIGLPVAQLRDQMLACIREDAKSTDDILDTHDRRGKSLRCRVLCVPLHVGDHVRGVVLLMEQQPPGSDGRRGFSRQVETL